MEKPILGGHRPTTIDVLWLNSPVHIRAGFRAIFVRPAMALAEIAWRWAFGAAAWALVIFAIHRVFSRVDVTQLELLIARHSDLFLIADACARIVVQVLPQLAREGLVLVPAIAGLWIAAGTVGRGITLNALFSAGNPEESAVFAGVEPNQPATGATGRRTVRYGPLLLLHLVRALFTIAALIAGCGAVLLAGIALAAQNPAAAAGVSLLLVSVVMLFWAMVNWFLALAPVWIVRDGRPAFAAISDSLQLYRRDPGVYVGIATSFGLIRALALVAAIVAALIASQASPAAAVAMNVVIALVYFAVADFLYIARLAAFVSLNQSALSAISMPSPVPESFLSASLPPAGHNG